MDQFISRAFGSFLNPGSESEKSKSSKSIYKYGYRVIQKEGILGFAMPKLSQLLILRDERSKLIQSSTIMFGNESMRLVNIAFQSSKLFPLIMGTYDAVSQYLQKELQQRFPKQHFHIIIAENDAFDFSISDYSHFADIKHEQYRVLIFSTKPREKTKLDTHDANSQMKLQWKSVVCKQI